MHPNNKDILQLSYIKFPNVFDWLNKTLTKILAAWSPQSCNHYFYNITSYILLINFITFKCNIIIT